MEGGGCKQYLPSLGCHSRVQDNENNSYRFEHTQAFEIPSFASIFQAQRQKQTNKDSSPRIFRISRIEGKERPVLESAFRVQVNRLSKLITNTLGKVRNKHLGLTPPKISQHPMGRKYMESSITRPLCSFFSPSFPVFLAATMVVHLACWCCVKYPYSQGTLGVTGSNVHLGPG